MKILEVTRVISFIIETDKKVFPTFRRSELGGSWENLMGESWESVYSNEDELEAAYQEWLRSNAAPHTGAVAPSVQALVGNSGSEESR